MFVILDGLCEVPHERLEGYVLEVGVEGDLRLHEGAEPKEESLFGDPLSNMYLIFKSLKNCKEKIFISIAQTYRLMYSS